MTERSEAINELAAALAKAQGVYAPVRKSGLVPAFGGRRERRYATLDDILEGTRKALTENGLSVLQVMGDDDHLQTILLHASGQWFGSTFRLFTSDNKDANAAQQLGSALTYARRYAMSALLGVVADEDDDAEDSGTASVKGRTKQAATPPETTKGLCRVHKTPFREGKNGGWYCPNKLADGSWCKERPQTSARVQGQVVDTSTGEVVEEPDPFEDAGPADGPMPAAAAVPPVTKATTRAPVPKTQAEYEARKAKASSLTPGAKGVQALLPVAWSRWNKQPAEVLAALGGGTAAIYAERDSAELEATLAALWDAPKEAKPDGH